MDLLCARISETFCMSLGEDVLIISIYLSATVYLDYFLIIFHHATEMYDNDLNGNITVGSGKDWVETVSCRRFSEFPLDLSDADGPRSPSSRTCWA